MFIIGDEQSLKDLKPPNLLVNEPNYPPMIIDDATLYMIIIMVVTSMFLVKK